MKKVFLLFLIMMSGIVLQAQSDYFQQEVDYKIEVTLDDGAHELTGKWELKYKNNAPNPLKEIYVHLWPDAYKSRNTAFARQKVRQGDTDFYFAKPAEQGGFRDLNFKIDGQAVKLTRDQENPDIGILKLKEPLASGASITVQTPFTLKIPNSFSRLGHVGDSYQMTQWYPKPAVYDRDGWHPMPYLDMGEFYSEFGSFDVTITLPQNYVVAATGELQTATEKAFLNEKLKTTNQYLSSLPDNVKGLTDTFPTSSNELKTIHFTANQVHDFAWFADKRFQVQKSEVILDNQQTIDTWAFFTNEEIDLWKTATSYLDRSVKFYSQHVGPYPYTHATAVQSALSAGGGMEYPMITVIGLSGNAQALDEVITHEVGHNWFYGILASNERDHAWMDEGLNSFYDHRYRDQYYEKTRFQDKGLAKWLFNDSSIDLLELGYLYQARRHEDQAPETTSDDFKLINYWLGAYEKPAIALKWLENYLGLKRFDQAMKSYYQKWQFKHPQPTDFRHHLETETGKDLTWLFDGLINGTGHVDYTVTNIQTNKNGYDVTIKNKGEIAAPFPVSGLKGDEVVTTQFVEGFIGEKVITMTGGPYEQVVVDATEITTDINRRNNRIKTSGAFKKMEPLQLKFIAGIENPKKTTVYWSPLVGYNLYDGPMLGLGLYNIGLPHKNFEFSLLPMYAFGSKGITGFGQLSYRFYPEADWLKNVELVVDLKRFHFNENEEANYRLRYNKITPSVTLNLGHQLNKKFSHHLQLRALLIDEEGANFTRDTVTNNAVFTGKSNEQSQIYELSYQAENRRGINPYKLRLALEQQSYSSFQGDQNYLKASVDYTTKYTYKPDRNVSFRFFLGGFLQNTRRDAGNVANRSTRGSIGLIGENFNDYKYDELFFGRSEGTGFYSQQISLNDGGFKTPVGSSQASNLGYSNSFVFAINFKADLPQSLPLNLPLKPYFDIGYFDKSGPINDAATFSDQLLYNGGLMLDFFDGMVGIYFPLFYSKNLKDLIDQRGDGYFSRVSFNIDFKKMNPAKLRERVAF